MKTQELRVLIDRTKLYYSIKNILCLLFLALCFFSTAQVPGNICGLSLTEYGTFSLNDSSYSIENPSLNWDVGAINVTFDPANLRYIYHKEGGNISDTVIVLDAVNGAILQKIPIPDATLTSMEYNDLNDKIYGLGATGFGSLDLANGVYSLISNSFNWDDASGYSAIDPTDSWYIYVKNGFSSDTLIVLSTINGSEILKIATLRYLFNGLEYDHNTNTIYSLGDLGFTTWGLNDTNVGAMNIPTYYKFMAGHNSTFDSQNMRYFCMKEDSGNVDTLVVINAVSGYFSHKIPINSTRLNCMEYALLPPLNTLLFDNEPIYKVYPNPTKGSFRLAFPESKESIVVTITDIKGTILLQKSVNQSNEIEMNIGNLPPGTYLLDATISGKFYVHSIIQKE